VVSANGLVAGQAGVDPFGPGMHATGENLQVVEAGLLELAVGLKTSGSVVARQRVGLRRVELVQAGWNFAERKRNGARDLHDGVLVHLAHVEQRERFPGPAPAIELLDCERRYAGRIWLRFLAANATERFVVDRGGDGRSRAAHKACAISPYRQLAEFKAKRIEQHESTDERIAQAEDQLENLKCLQGSNDARETPSTPPSAHDGTRPGGGGSGKRQR
jgi:hypothetical protein